MTTPSVLRRLFAENGVAAGRVEGLTRSALHLLPEYLSRHRAQLLAGGTVMPGAVEALRAVHDDPLFVSTVVTGNLRSTAQIKLETFGLDAYLDMDLGGFASDDDSRPRLVAIAQQRAAARHGIPFTRLNTVSVGDSHEDLRTAQLGGCRILAVASGTTLNTDISIIGVPNLPGPDEDAFGPRLTMTAGGKARNAAEMLAKLLGPGSVAFAGRTVLLCDGWDLADAATCAVRAGALQFHRTGVRPLSLYEIVATNPDSDNRI